MERKIKFRAWEDGVMYNNLSYVTMGGNAMSKKPDKPLVKPILMQFTGLTDKNGVEIYEGDIVRILYTDWPSNTDKNISLEDYKKSISSIGKVEYHAPRFHLIIYSKRFDEFLSSSLVCGTHGEIEVIGNIHQNPELLKC